MPKSRRLIVATLSSALLGACANVDVDRSVAGFDEETYARDLSECRGGSAVAFVAEAMGHTLLGSAYGLLHGAVIAHDEDLVSCLRDKGYATEPL